MGRSKKAQFLFIGGQWDGIHHITEAYENGSPLQEYERVMNIEPYTQADWKAQEATRTVSYTTYRAEQLRDPQNRRYWVFVADGVNLLAALIDGYRRKG